MKKKDCVASLDAIRNELFRLQNIFFADKKYALLIILQGMDASGKDSTIRHVFTSMNPMGVNVKSFVKPTPEEMQHDFLWRCYPHFPAKGMIEIFNRSYYEDIIVPHVSRSLDNNILEERCELINLVERNLLKEKTIILKFFLNISLEEQKKRISERESRPDKKWKFDVNDRHSEKKWNEYLDAYTYVINNCGLVPWNIIPSDKKWYRNYLVGSILLDEMKKLKLRYPGAGS